MSSNERRAQERIASAQPASVYLEDGTTFPCTIADFCDQGMFITFSEDMLSVSTQIRILRVSFRTTSGTELFVNAQPMHISKNSAGLRFSTLYPQVISYLAQRSEPKHTELIAPQYKAIAEYCLVETESAVMSVIETAFPKIIEALREEALVAATDQEANAFMSTMEKLEKREKLVLSKARSELLKLESLAPSTSGSDELSPNSSSSNDLTVVEKQAFEDWLISRVLITKLEASFRTALLLLKMRTDHMGYLSPVNGSPLGPERAVYAFRAAIHPHLSNATLEKRAFKVFEQVALDQLGALYDQLNSILESEGVLTNAKLGVKKEPERAVTPVVSANKERAAAAKLERPERDDAQNRDQRAGEHSIASEKTHLASKSLGYGGAPLNHFGINEGNISALDLDERTSEDRASDRVAKGALSSLGKMLGRFRSKSSAPDSIDDSVPLFSLNEVDSGLSKLHGQTRDLNSASETLTLLERVMTGLEIEGEIKALDSEQKDRIDVVDKFFGSLQHNPRLSDEGKQHLFRLEIPVLRQLLENSDFFDGQDSPLRDVLNRIARLGAQGGRLGRVGHQKIEQLVIRINEEYDHNKGVLDEVKHALDDLLAKQHALYIKNVERVAAAADSAHKIEHTRQRVTQILQEYLAGKEVPLALVCLLDSGWKEHLSLLGLKHGIDSTEFKQGFEVIEALINFGLNPKVGFDAQRYVPQIQEGLQYLSDGAAGIKRVREELKQLLLDARENKHAMVPAPYIEDGSTLKSTDREQINVEKSKRLQEWIEKAKTIPLNSWLRLQKEESAPEQFIRLVWIAKGYSKFVFVNHQGLKVVELGLFKLAEYLKHQKVTPDPEFNQPIVKQGLDDMVKEVYDRLAFDSSHDQQSGLPNDSEFKRRMRSHMQNGERTSQCCLVYLRCLTGELDHAGEASVVDLLVNTLKPFSEENALDVILGRMNHYDYAVFVSGSDAKTKVAVLKGLLENAKSKLSGVDYGVAMLYSEVWGYLGFHNQSQLIVSAADNLEQLNAKSDASTGSQKTIELKKERSIEPLNLNDPEDIGSLTVLVQEVRKLSSQYACYSKGSALDSHRSLVCMLKKIPADAVLVHDFYVPDSKSDAEALANWWIAYLSNNLQLNHGDIVYRVPLDARCLTSKRYIQSLNESIEHKALSAECIIFDLMNCTELESLHATADAIRELQVLGFRFSLLGFGTPDCPSDLVQTLPINGVTVAAESLALDKDLGGDEAQSLVDVAHHFSKIVFACEVDSAIALQKVEKFDVDFVQGARVDVYHELT